jgi:octaprenyl-diphosphate synthase
VTQVTSISPERACSAQSRDFASLLEPYSAEMRMLDQVMDACIESLSGGYFPEAREICRGGKRLRAALCIGSARAFSADPDVIRLAVEHGACIEGIHLSSLLHDDVIDNASERRGISTLHNRYGRTGAILAGDLLYVKVFRRLMDTPYPEVMRTIVDGVIEMVEGETWQTLDAVLGKEPSIDEYCGCISRKTAGFFRAAVEAGAMLGSRARGGLTPEQVEAVRTFGHDFGMAFQIVDDILDWTADPGVLGKELLADIKSRKLTLPLLLFLEDDPAAARACIARALDGAIVPLANEITRRGHLRRAYRFAEKYSRSAAQALEVWPAETENLNAIVRFTVGRCF